MDSSGKEMANLRAIIEWSAYHNHEASLAASLEEFTKLDGILDEGLQDLLRMNLVRTVVSGIKETDADEQSDVFGDILQSLDALEAKHPGALPPLRWGEAKRLCVVQKALKCITNSWFKGEIPSRAEDIKLATNHNFYPTVETIKTIFRDHKDAYLKYAETDPLFREKFDHDIESLSVDIVKAQNAGKLLKVQKLKLFDQFEAHTLAAFKQHIFLLIEDLLKSVYPRPSFLQSVYEGDNIGQSWEHPPASSSALANKKIVKKPGNKVIKPASIIAAATAKKPVVAATKIDFAEDAAAKGHKRSASALAEVDSDSSDSDYDEGHSKGIQLLKDTAAQIGDLEASGKKRRKKAPVRDSSSGRMRWTFEEEEAFRAAFMKYGLGNWAKMLEDPVYGYVLKARTNINLKDKHRTMKKAGLLPVETLPEAEDQAAGSSSSATV